MIERAAIVVAKPFLIEWAIRIAISQAARDTRVLWWLRRVGSGAVRVRAWAVGMLLASIAVFGAILLACVYLATGWWLVVGICALIPALAAIAAGCVAWYLAWTVADWVTPAVMAFDPAWHRNRNGS